MRLNVPPVTLPFWVPCTHLYFYIFLNWLTVRLKKDGSGRRIENGRETGERRERERIALPCPQPFVYRHLSYVTGPREGHFRMRRLSALNASFIHDSHIEDSRSVRSHRTYSPRPADWQSVGTDKVTKSQFHDNEISSLKFWRVQIFLLSLQSSTGRWS